MTQAVKNWLPKAAFSDNAVKAALSAPVGLWSERWFARQAAAISAVRIVADRTQVSTAAQSLRVSGSVADAELPGRGKRVLLEALLDIDLAGQTPIEGDHHLMDTLAARVMDDLLAVLDETFGSEAARSDGATIAASLSIAGSEMMTVSFSDSAVVPLLKAQLGAARPARAKPRSRLAALGPMRVTAEGVLGRAELALSDLKGLAAGDVLILDRALQEPVDLQLSGTGVFIARGKLGRNDGRISIQL